MLIRAALALLIALPTMASAQPAPPPKLVVAISIDQFSADLFAQHRASFTGGLKRLTEGVVFPSGFQAHAATETCPGHATILTGVWPGRAGVIANNWVDQSIARDDKTVYCAEDETRGRSSKAGEYVPSPLHLRVPTLGDLMKARDARSRIVAVAGKDRAAIMMGGKATDAIWFLRPTDHAAFETLEGRGGTASVTRANRAIEAALRRPMPPMPLSARCAVRARPVAVGPRNVGDGRFARPADANGADGRPNMARALFRASPEADAAVLDLAEAMVADLRLGRGPATDLIAVGLSATDVIGHAYGTDGSEMCIQLEALDRALGRFLATLDRTGVDYVVALTADHGGHDTPERNAVRAIAEAARVESSARGDVIGRAVAQAMGLQGSVLMGNDTFGDMWIDRSVVPTARLADAVDRVAARYREHPQVAAVFTAAQIRGAARPMTPPDEWSLLERAAAAHDPARSGDLVVMLRPRVTPITAEAARSYVATHGSPWDYDRRVPILFWRKGMTPFEQPNAIDTVDIAPTLAALIGLPIAPGAMDGVCRDLDAGPRTTCP